MEPIDEIKVRAVIALSDDLHDLDPKDDRYPAVLERLDRIWRTLTPAEQDEIDRVLGQRGMSKRLRIVQVSDTEDE